MAMGSTTDCFFHWIPGWPHREDGRGSTSTFPDSVGPLRWKNPAGCPKLPTGSERRSPSWWGEGKFAILGNSFGGLLAGRMASVFGNQVLGLALLAPVVHPRPRDRSGPRRSILHRDPEFLDSLDPSDAREFGQMAVYQSVGAWTGFRDAALPGIRAADAQAGSRLARRYQLDTDSGQHLPPLKCPTLIITGRQDHIVGFEDRLGLLRKYENASYAVLHCAGHNVHLDQPGSVDTLLKDWRLRVQTTTS